MKTYSPLKKLEHLISAASDIMENVSLYAVISFLFPDLWLILLRIWRVTTTSKTVPIFHHPYTSSFFLLLFVSLTETYLYLVLLMNLMIHIRYSKSNVKMTVRTYIEMIKSNVATIALLVCFCSAIFVMHLTSVDGLYGFESEPLPTLFTERTTLTITVCWLSTSQ